MTLSFIFIMDILGTIAFACSGAVVGIRKGMDIFGVNILAITTAVGGGVVRDVLIGVTPPEMFRNPLYAGIAVITANICFLFLYLKKNKVPKNWVNHYERILFLCDTLGLAAFTVDGVNAGQGTDMSNNMFLVVFLGVVTGVGGGLIRDMMASRRPYIFVKHIYASASLLGALATAGLWKKAGGNTAMLIGFVIVIIIRVLAAYYEWNLPRVYEKDLEQMKDEENTLSR